MLHTLQEWFSFDCEDLSCNQFVFLCQLKTKRNFQFPLYSKAQYLCFSSLWVVFCYWLQTIREKCVLLIYDTFGVLWFLSLEYVILFSFSFDFNIIATCLSQQVSFLIVLLSL